MRAPVITAASVDVRRVPPHRAITDAVQEMDAVEIVAVEVTTEAATGTGFTYTLGRAVRPSPSCCATRSFRALWDAIRSASRRSATTCGGRGTGSAEPA